MNCKDCVYWRHIRDEDYPTQDEVWPGPHGECKVIDNYSWDKDRHEAEQELAHIDVVAVYYVNGVTPFVDDGIQLDKENHSIEGNLITSPNFGCVLFKEKEQGGGFDVEPTDQETLNTLKKWQEG